MSEIQMNAGGPLVLVTTNHKVTCGEGGARQGGGGGAPT